MTKTVSPTLEITPPGYFPGQGELGHETGVRGESVDHEVKAPTFWQCY